MRSNLKNFFFANPYLPPFLKKTVVGYFTLSFHCKLRFCTNMIMLCITGFAPWYIYAWYFYITCFIHHTYYYIYVRIWYAIYFPVYNPFISFHLYYLYVYIINDFILILISWIMISTRNVGLLSQTVLDERPVLLRLPSGHMFQIFFRIYDFITVSWQNSCNSKKKKKVLVAKSKTMKTFFFHFVS